MVLGTGSAEEILRRIRGEYLEMPGPQLNVAQASRLWGMDQTTCAGHLNSLVHSGFLVCTSQGCYVRLDPASPRQHAMTRPGRVGHE